MKRQSPVPVRPCRNPDVPHRFHCRHSCLSPPSSTAAQVSASLRLSPFSHLVPHIRAVFPGMFFSLLPCVMFRYRCLSSSWYCHCCCGCVHLRTFRWRSGCGSFVCHLV